MVRDRSKYELQQARRQDFGGDEARIWVPAQKGSQGVLPPENGEQRT